jgi:hypothetical protein
LPVTAAHVHHVHAQNPKQPTIAAPERLAYLQLIGERFNFNRLRLPDRRTVIMDGETLRREYDASGRVK